jgi:hypothetical protein
MNSIEYLEKEYNENKGFLGSSNFEQAKEMHKQEMKQLSQQEISDEEIWEASIDYDNGATYDTPIVHFQQGAFWYREQLKQKQ